MIAEVVWCIIVLDDIVIIADSEDVKQSVQVEISNKVSQW